MTVSVTSMCGIRFRLFQVVGLTSPRPFAESNSNGTTMKQSQITFAWLVGLSALLPSNVFAQNSHGDYGVTHPLNPRPIAVADRTNGKVRELVRIHLTDYEVWVVDRASMQMKYKVHMLDRWGWTTHQTADEYAWYSSDTLFESRKQAVEAFRDLQRQFGDYIDFEVEAIAPQPRWAYVDTFPSEGKARSFLELLLSVIPEYDGKVVEVRRSLPALRD